MNEHTHTLKRKIHGTENPGARSGHSLGARNIASSRSHVATMRQETAVEFIGTGMAA